MDVRFLQTWPPDQRRTPAILSGYQCRAVLTDIRPDLRLYMHRPHSSHRWPASSLRSAPPDRQCTTTTSHHTKNHVSIYYILSSIFIGPCRGLRTKDIVLSLYFEKEDMVFSEKIVL